MRFLSLIFTRPLVRICFISVCVYIFIFITKPGGTSKKLLRFLASYPFDRDKSERVYKQPPCSRFSNGRNRTQSEHVKKILLWSPLFKGMEFLSAGTETFSKYECKERQCEITYDRSLLIQSHAVVFHIRTFDFSDVPQRRSCEQKWIFFSLESPPYSYFPGYELIDDIFNWTMTYRFDSDVVIGYGNVTKTEKLHERWNSRSFLASWKTKRKIAVWMVSHCSTASNREGYVDELLKYMDVDIIGECGIAVCPSNKTDLCLKSFARFYKFYFAFENSICDGYVTEKLYRVLQYDIVPVVLGGSNYSELLPPKSFINALDFTPQHLARYLRKVASDSSLYLEYFEWKTTGNYAVQDSPLPCDLCTKLHSESLFDSNRYENITEWWVTKSHCRKWKHTVHQKR